MSSISSQELAASASDSKEPGCEPSRSARSTNGAETDCKTGGQECFVFPTSEASPEHVIRSSMPLMASAVDFLARTRALDKPSGASALASTASAQDSSATSSVWPMTYDPSSSSWRMCQASLVPDLDKFSEPWPRSGLMQSGVAFLHPRPASPIVVIASGLLPTPAARDYRDLSAGKAFLSQRRRHSPSMATRLLERGVHWSAISTAYEVAMGFPSRWTAGELKRLGTPLSRKSRKSSGAKS